MVITNLTNEDGLVRQTAELLVVEFSNTGTDSWKTIESASEEVLESLGEGRISRIATDEHDKVLGWVGGIEEYDGNVWELHPLVVRGDFQGKGIGRALVQDFESEVKKRGGMTIRLGTDDENNRTSLAGLDLYPDVLKHLSEIKNLRRHPFEFYQKLGYTITGVIPDANGLGKPDILMVKRIS